MTDRELANLGLETVLYMRLYGYGLESQMKVMADIMNGANPKDALERENARLKGDEEA